MIVIGSAAPAQASTERWIERGSMYVIGDSWSAGLFADPEHTLVQDAAARLGLSVTVDAQSGTGYLTAPLGTSTYLRRARRISPDTDPGLVLIQGGSNDADADPSALLTAAEETIIVVRNAFPTALIVLLGPGPGPDPWPVTAKQSSVDSVLRDAARQQGAGYISPLEDGWFTPTSVRSIIDPLTSHPTVSGDEILGEDLAEALISLHDRTGGAVR